MATSDLSVKVRVNVVVGMSWIDAFKLRIAGKRAASVLLERIREAVRVNGELEEQEDAVGRDSNVPCG